MQKHQTLCLAEWERNGPWHSYAYYIASNHARLGDRENALAWLERGAVRTARVKEYQD